jgi:hypothetical protein
MSEVAGTGYPVSFVKGSRRRLHISSLPQRRHELEHRIVRSQLRQSQDQTADGHFTRRERARGVTLDA